MVYILLLYVLFFCVLFFFVFVFFLAVRLNSFEEGLVFVFSI